MQTLLDYMDSIHPLSLTLREYLTQILKERHFLKREYLLKAGHICRSICFVEKGLFRCFYHKGEHEVCSWFMREGEVIVSVESFFEQRESYESIQALEDSAVYYIQHSELEHLYRAYPEFNFIARVLLQKYYTLSEQRLYAMRLQSAGERYHYLLENEPELVLRVSNTDLASYLGISRETVSRIRGVLRR